MYCVKCGVKLGDAEKKCPLCNTVPFHPEIERKTTEASYPENSYPRQQQVSPLVALIIVSTMCLIPFIVTLLCDLQVNRSITWSGYVMGALIVGYVIFILPFWFKKPNPVVFVPCGFAVVGLYVAYINYACDGNWFLSFAFPLIGGVALVVTAVVVLVKYLKRGRLFVFGGAILALGAMSFPMEILINVTFGTDKFYFWSLYPISVSVILGGLLIFLAAYKPARELMERKFFV